MAWFIRICFFVNSVIIQVIKTKKKIQIKIILNPQILNFSFHSTRYVITFKIWVRKEQYGSILG